MQEEILVNLCNMYMVENTQRGEQVMILDHRAHMSLARRPWLERFWLNSIIRSRTWSLQNLIKFFNMEELKRDMEVN